MATGRTLPAFQKVFINGREMSCYVVDTGEQGMEFGAPEIVTLCDPVIGVLPTKPTVKFGPINGVFDNTATTGLHVIASGSQTYRQNLMVIYGIRAVPAFGDPCFCVPMLQINYQAVGSEIVTVNIQYDGPDSAAGMTQKTYFGNMLHVSGAETAANTANTNLNNGAASAKGGWLMYQIQSITGAGTVTISIDDSADGTTWAALSGATSGAIATASAPLGGYDQLAATAAVRQYLRWQIAFGGSATACTFALAFMRGRNLG